MALSLPSRYCRMDHDQDQTLEKAFIAGPLSPPCRTFPTMLLDCCEERTRTAQHFKKKIIDLSGVGLLPLQT